MIANRRQLLTSITGIAAFSIPNVIGGTKSEKDRASGELPSDVSNVAEVCLPESMFQPQTITTDQWIVHRFGWRTEKEEDTSKLVELQNKAEYEFQIDGKSIPNASTYWSDIVSTDNDTWRISWQYATPPVSSGFHTFTVKYHLSEPFHSLTHRGETQTLHGSYELDRDYHVLTQSEAQQRALKEHLRIIENDLHKFETIRKELQAVRSLHSSQQKIDVETLTDVVNTFSYSKDSESPLRNIRLTDDQLRVKLRSPDEVNQAINKINTEINDLKAEREQLQKRIQTSVEDTSSSNHELTSPKLEY